MLFTCCRFHLTINSIDQGQHGRHDEKVRRQGKQDPAPGQESKPGITGQIGSHIDKKATAFLSGQNTFRVKNPDPVSEGQALGCPVVDPGIPRGKGLDCQRR